MQTNNEAQPKLLGSILLIIGWIIAIALLGYLYHKSIYAAKPAVFNVDTDVIKITIHRQRDGHFRIPAFINGKKIVFLIDTGATKTALAQSIAKEIGLSFDYPVKAYTANGEVAAFLTQINFIDIGPLKLQNVSAIILLDLHDQGLLGMNVLKQFTMTQHEDIMELTYDRRNQ